MLIRVTGIPAGAKEGEVGRLQRSIRDVLLSFLSGWQIFDESVKIEKDKRRMGAHQLHCLLSGFPSRLNQKQISQMVECLLLSLGSFVMISRGPFNLVRVSVQFRGGKVFQRSIPVVSTI